MNSLTSYIRTVQYILAHYSGAHLSTIRAQDHPGHRAVTEWSQKQKLLCNTSVDSLKFILICLARQWSVQSSFTSNTVEQLPHFGRVILWNRKWELLDLESTAHKPQVPFLVYQSPWHIKHTSDHTSKISCEVRLYSLSRGRTSKVRPHKGEWHSWLHNCQLQSGEKSSTWYIPDCT